MASSKRGSFNPIRALESARECGQERFEISPRMQRLDRCEQTFARQVFKRAGGSQATVVDIPCGNGRLYPILSAAKQLRLLDYARRRFVALSLYDKATWRYVRKRLRNKTPSGYAVGLRTFRQEADEAGLRLVLKYPRLSFIEQQRCLLFEKKDLSRATP